MDQPKIERVLRLMQLMSGTVNYSVGELADKLETSPRTIYRYIDTFKDAGFVVEKVHGDVYRIAEMSSRYPNLENLIYFSEEEAHIVNSLIDRLDSTNTLKANLHKKLASIYESTSIADYVDRKSNAANVEALSTAIREQKCAKLINYESGNSGSVRNRLVEPFAFSTNFIDIWAYDKEDCKNKVFKIARIEEVEVLDEGWTDTELHRRQPTDIFRMSGEYMEHIRLGLSTLAKNLLTEEYPLSEKYLRKWKEGWMLETDICNLRGAGRFVMGLPGDVKILEGERLKQYISEEIEKLGN